MKIDEKLLDIVEDLNSDAFANVLDDKSIHPFDGISPFEFSSSVFATVVLFFGLCVWSTEEDKEWDDDDKPVNIKALILARAKDYTEFIAKSVK